MDDSPKQRNKPTKEEHNARIEECMRLLRMRSNDGKPITAGTIKKLFKQKYGCHHITALRYIKKAQDRIVSESGLSKSAHKALTVEFLNGIIGDAGQKTADRLAANKQYMDLFGLAVAPKSAPDAGLQQHLHLHSATPLTIEQRKQALLEHLGIRASDHGSDDRGGIVATRSDDVIEIPRVVPRGSGSPGGHGIADSQGMEVGTESDAGQ